MKVTARKLLSRFVASALDMCAERDKLSEEQVGYLHHLLVSEALGREPEMEKPEGVDRYLQEDGRVDFSKIVPVATGRLSVLALQLGESEINERVVQEYLNGAHNKILADEQEINPRETVESCGVHEAKVIRRARDGDYIVKITHPTKEELRKVSDPFNSKPEGIGIVHRSTWLGKKHELRE